MSKEAIGENGAALGSSDYWDRVNRSTIFGRLMHRSSETNYHQTLQDTGRRAAAAIAEVYDDLQDHIGSVRAIPSENRRALAKQVEELYDICRMSGVSCSRSSDCAGILNLSAFYLPRAASLDDRAVQEAVRKIRNHPDFFAGECVELIQKAVDWSVSFAAGSDKRKRAFLEDISQGKNKEFLQDVLDAYHSSKGLADLRGSCGRSIGSRDYREHLERKVFLQELSSMQRDDYDGALKDALSSIAHQLQRDLALSERDNNYITDETARLLRDTVKDLEQCGIHTGIPDSAIGRLAWFVGGDPAKIRRLQSSLNALGIGEHLEEDGVYGEKTENARSALLNELVRGTFPTITWIDPLQSNSTGIHSAIKTTRDSRMFSRLVDESGIPLFRADLHPYKGNPLYYHINVDTLPSTPLRSQNLAQQLDHLEISKEAYTVLKNFQQSGKVIRIAGRVLLVAGSVLDALTLCETIDNDLHDADQKIGKKTYRSLADIGGSWIGGALGAKSGAWVGATIGTAILPGIGTAVGGIAGGLILGIAGSFAGSSLGEWVIDITEIGE